jgi:hypothetical protein
MARDKVRDDKYFHCSEQHEFNYVAGLYDESDKVRDFLKKRCDDRTINRSTHLEVYQLIKGELGYDIPVSY